jgi:hypothetical protein
MGMICRRFEIPQTVVAPLAEQPEYQRLLSRGWKFLDGHRVLNDYRLIFVVTMERERPSDETGLSSTN